MRQNEQTIKSIGKAFALHSGKTPLWIFKLEKQYLKGFGHRVEENVYPDLSKHFLVA